MASPPPTRELAAEIHSALSELGTPERAENEKRYLKSDLKHYGVTMPAIRKCAKEFLGRHSDIGRDTLTALVSELWDGEYYEPRTMAVELLDMRSGLLGPDDMPTLERLLRNSHTWALVDSLAATVVGSLVKKHPTLAGTLDRWATHEDFWIRRSAMLALLVELRQGRGDWDRFARYADSMLEETEFFIRKAIGWILRDTSKRRPDLVYEWLAPRAGRASGVTVREAVRYLAPHQRDAVMSAYRERRSVD